MASGLPSNVHVSQHPCVRAKLSQLRAAGTNARETKALVHEIALLVGCEALAKGLSVQTSGTGKSPLGYSYSAETISPSSSKISLVPILRSGLSMVDSIQSLLPEPVSVHHLGLYREKTTLQPVEYYNNLPYHRRPSSTDASGSSAAELAIIVDPIVATGATLEAAIETLRDWGVNRIIAIAILGSTEGLRRAAEVWPEDGKVEIWLGGVDQETDEKGMIKPGLGDIGDRLFLTLGK